MPLKAKVKTLDGLDESQAKLYKQTTQDGESFYILDVEGVDGFALENVQALTNALGRQKAKVDEVQDQLKAFEGIDPAKAKDALQKLEKMKGLDPERDAERIAAEKFETMKAQLVEQHQNELKARDAKLTKAEKEVDDLTRVNAARAAIEKADGNVRLLLPHVLNRTRPKVRDDGVRIVEVLNEDGTPMYGSNGQNKSVEELVAEMKASADYGSAFKAAGQSGSGTPPSNGSGGGSPPPTGNKKAQEMTVAEKSAFIEEHGLETWNDKISKDYAVKPASPGPASS